MPARWPRSALTLHSSAPLCRCRRQAAPSPREMATPILVHAVGQTPRRSPVCPGLPEVSTSSSSLLYLSFFLICGTLCQGTYPNPGIGLVSDGVNVLATLRQSYLQGLLPETLARNWKKRLIWRGKKFGKIFGEKKDRAEQICPPKYHPFSMLHSQPPAHFST